MHAKLMPTTTLSWNAVCIVSLIGLHPALCAKLPSWRGPYTFFDGVLPSERASHGFVAGDDGRLYVFGGNKPEGQYDSSKMCVVCNSY